MIRNAVSEQEHCTKGPHEYISALVVSVSHGVLLAD